MFIRRVQTSWCVLRHSYDGWLSVIGKINCMRLHLILKFLEWAVSLTTWIQQPHQSWTSERFTKVTGEGCLSSIQSLRQLINSYYVCTQLQNQITVQLASKRRLKTRNSVPIKTSIATGMSKDKRIGPLHLCQQKVWFLAVKTQAANE